MLNLDNGVRFTNAGWQLAALLPVPVKKQGNYKGKVTLVSRKCQIFHGTCHLTLIDDFYSVSTLQFD